MSAVLHFDSRFQVEVFGFNLFFAFDFGVELEATRVQFGQPLDVISVYGFVIWRKYNAPVWLGADELTEVFGLAALTNYIQRLDEVGVGLPDNLIKFNGNYIQLRVNLCVKHS